MMTIMIPDAQTQMHTDARIYSITHKCMHILKNFASSLVSQSEQCRLVELIFEMRLSLSLRCWVPQVPQHSNLIAVGARKLKLCGRTPPFPPKLTAGLFWLPIPPLPMYPTDPTQLKTAI